MTQNIVKDAPIVTSKLVPQEVVDHALRHQSNILLRGKHGVGKTHIFLQEFRRKGWNYLYFSASTMDPWVDFIGVPREVKDEETNRSYMDLLRPRAFEFDNIDAIFLDEFNRAPKKVRNALMELIQFKSVNGKRFDRLKCVVAAVNPDDDANLKYDVESMDPAQMDRFQHIIDVPYQLDGNYLTAIHGGPLSSYFQKWWNGQTAAVKDKVSPRRVDYVMQAYRDAMADGASPSTILALFGSMLPKEVNIQELYNQLGAGIFGDTLAALRTASDEEKMAFFRDHNNTKQFEKACANPTKAHPTPSMPDPNAVLREFLPYLPEEIINGWMTTGTLNEALGEPPTTPKKHRGWQGVVDAFNNSTHPRIVEMREERKRLQATMDNAMGFSVPPYVLPTLTPAAPSYEWDNTEMDMLPTIPALGDLSTTPKREEFYQQFSVKVPADVVKVWGSTKARRLFEAFVHVLQSSNAPTMERMPNLGSLIVHIGLCLRMDKGQWPKLDDAAINKLQKQYMSDWNALTAIDIKPNPEAERIAAGLETLK